MKMLYILNQRMPTQKAYGFQAAKMCESFSDVGINLELVVPYRVNSGGDIFHHYFIKKNFKFKKIFSPDFYLPGGLDRISFWFKNLISACVLGIYALHSGADIVYSREELPLYLLSLVDSKKLVFEAHGFSKRRRMFYSRFNKQKVKIVAITAGIKENFVKFGYKPDNILVAHDGVDLDEFHNLTSVEEIKKT